MTKAFLLFFLTISMCGKLQAQSIHIEGEISDSITGLPVIFASVGIVGSFIGTITNKDGGFSLKIPLSEATNSILISCIGYENCQINSIIVNHHYQIVLRPKSYIIPEVTVLSDSTILNILKKSFGKIYDNYPISPIRQQGFYRESLREKNGDYQYFAELILDIYKSSYKNKSLGHVGIKDSRKSKINFSDSINDIRFYGGHFSPITRDVVKMRYDFINPKKFNDYKYRYYGIDKYLDNAVYIIQFYANPNSIEAEYDGKIMIDTTTYAYIAFELQYSENGLRGRNNNQPYIPLKCQDRKQLVLYQKDLNKYFLKYTNDIETTQNIHTQKVLVSEDEFICTAIQSNNVSPIPFDDQMPRTSVVSEFSNPYNKTSWKDYIILVPDSHLVKLKKYTDSEATDILRDNIRNNVENNCSKNFMRNILLDTGFSLSFFNNTTSVINIIYSPNEENNYNVEKKLSNKYLYCYYGSLGYQLSRKFSALVSFTTIVNKSKFFDESVFIGGEYNFPVYNRGIQLVANLSLNYFYKKSGFQLGQFESKLPFEVNEKRFDSEIIGFSLGSVYHGLSSRISLSTRIKDYWHLFVSAGFRQNIFVKDYLFINEKSGLLTSNMYEKINIKSSAIIYTEDKKELTNLSFHLNPISIGIGIRYTLKY